MLIRQTLQYAPAQIIGPLAQFAGVVIWTHMLGPSEYGFVLLILAIQELGYLLGLCWWSTYTLRYFAGIKDRRAYQASENAVMVTGALAQVPIVLAGLAWTGHLADWPLLATTLPYALSRSALSHVSERARAAGDIRAYTVAQTMGPLLGLPLGLLALRFMAPALAVTGGFALVQLAILPFLLARLGFFVRPAFRFEPAQMRAALVYGGPLLAAGGFNWLSINAIRFVVEHSQGAVALGLVSVGWNLGQRLMTLIATLVTAAAFPLAVKSFEQDGRQAGLSQLSNNAILLLGLLVPAALGAAAIAAPMTMVLVGPEFRADTLAILPLAALAAALRNVRVHFADQTFLLCEHPNFVLVLDVLEAVLTLVCCAIGLQYGGLVGACLGCFCAYLAISIYSFGVAVLRYRLVLPIAALLRFLVAGLVMAAAIHLPLFPPNWIGLGLRIGIGLLVYTAASLVLWLPVLPRPMLKWSLGASAD